MNFKNGDKVRATGGRKVGMLGEVIFVDDIYEKVAVMFYDKDFVNMDMYNLELIKKEEVIMGENVRKLKFEVGDKVESIGGFKQGAIGVIVELDLGNAPYEVEFEGGMCFMKTEKNLRLVAQKDSKPSKTTKLFEVFRNGLKTTVVFTVNGKKYSGSVTRYFADEEDQVKAIELATERALAKLIKALI